MLIGRCWVSNGELSLVLGSMECVKLVHHFFGYVFDFDQYFSIFFESEFVLSQDFHVSANSFGLAAAFAGDLFDMLQSFH